MTVDLRSPTPPRRPLLFLRWAWRLVLDVIDEYRRDGVGDLAAAITFWTILSIPAAALAVVSTLSSLDALIGASLARDAERAVLDFISETFTDAEPLISTAEELFRTNATSVATAATFIAIFSLSRAFAGVVRALDRAFQVTEGRPWWYLRIVAIGLGLGTMIVIAAGAVLFALLPTLPFNNLTRSLTAPAVFTGVVAWITALYQFGPNQRTPWRYGIPGAVLTSVGWLGTTQLFAFYVRYAGGNDVRNAVGAILLALTLLYVLSIVLLVGAELNDVLVRRAGVVQRRMTAGDRARQAQMLLRSLTPVRRDDIDDDRDDDRDHRHDQHRHGEHRHDDQHHGEHRHGEHRHDDQHHGEHRHGERDDRPGAARWSGGDGPRSAAGGGPRR